MERGLGRTAAACKSGGAAVLRYMPLLPLPLLPLPLLLPLLLPTVSSPSPSSSPVAWGGACSA